MTFALDSSAYTFQVLDASKLNGFYLPWTENAPKEAKKKKELRLYFMSAEDRIMTAAVGSAYGDSCLIVFPNGEVMLIDGGKSQYGEILKQNLKNIGISKIDYLVVSHIHEDHYGGIFGSSLLSSFDVGTFYWNGATSYQASVTTNILNDMKKRGVKTVALAAGDSLEIGGVHIDVLYPTSDLQKQVDSAADNVLNDTSLALKFTYQDFSYLTCGDLYSTAEDLILGMYSSDVLDVDVLKANHHGKQTSNSKAWAQATTPRVVVATSGIMMDSFPYGYYSSVGAYVLNDKLDGYVRIVTDGSSCTVTSSRKRTNTVNENFDKIARSIYPVELKTVKK